MWALPKLFLDIALLRGKPQDAPASPVVLGVVLALDIATTYFLIDGNIAGARFDAVVIHTFALALLVYGALRWRGLSARFVQTANALFGGGIVVTLVAWVIITALRVPFDIENPNFMLLTLLLSLWVLAIMAQVLRHALEVPLAVAVLTTFAISLARSAFTLLVPLS